MKVLLYFSLFLLASANLHSMEYGYDEGIIKLRCTHSNEMIEMPKNIAEHSLILKNHIEEYPAILRGHPIPIVGDRQMIHNVINCLKIIDSNIDVERRLLMYMYDIATWQERTDLFDAVENLKIQKFIETSEEYLNYAYDRNLDKVFQIAQTIFEKVEDKKSSAIIIDVDGTALSNRDPLGQVKINGFLFDYFPAINKVRDFYTQMVAMDFKIFFLTARVEVAYEATVFNLKNEGYDVFEQVICVPDEKRSQFTREANEDKNLFVLLHAEWKESERNKIAEKFVIVGTVDDIDQNLLGENVGYPILIPRFY